MVLKNNSNIDEYNIVLHTYYSKITTISRLKNKKKIEKEKIKVFCETVFSDYIETFVVENKDATSLIDEIDNCNPIEFEVVCANKLTQYGWRVSTTKTTGDQGADIIASLDDITIVVQCKKHKGNIGNKAVQEISSARLHYNADFAFVVGVSGYTKFAIQLAKTNNVFLLDYTELHKVNELVFKK